MEKKKKLTKLCNCDFQTLDMRHHKIQTSWALQQAPPNCVELFLSHNTERKLKKNQSVPLHLGCWVRSAGILSHLEMSGHNTGEEKATQRKSSGCVQRFSPKSSAENWSVGLVIRLLLKQLLKYALPLHRDRVNSFHLHLDNLFLLFIFLLS